LHFREIKTTRTLYNIKKVVILSRWYHNPENSFLLLQHRRIRPGGSREVPSEVVEGWPEEMPTTLEVPVKKISWGLKWLAMILGSNQ